jgi:antitoxin ParD1/3/4
MQEHSSEQMEELRKLIEVGIQQSERGEVAPLDMEAIKAKAALRLQQEQELAELKKLLAVGIEQADRGELIDGEIVFAKLWEKIRRRSEKTP